MVSSLGCFQGCRVLFSPLRQGADLVLSIYGGRSAFFGLVFRLCSVKLQFTPFVYKGLRVNTVGCFENAVGVTLVGCFRDEPKLIASGGLLETRHVMTRHVDCRGQSS